MKPVSILLGLGAVFLSIVAVFLAMWSPNGQVLAAGLVAHLGACVACGGAAYHRRGLTRIELDAVLLTAVYVPLFGPSLAWMMPLGHRGGRTRSAKEKLEELDERMRRADAAAPAPLYSGDFEEDLSRELNAMSYYEILDRGDLDQKRNALRKLARLGEPRHMELIKSYLSDQEPELRLCAYLEIDRLRIVHERRIAELRQLVQKSGTDDAGREARDTGFAELAEAHREYATCGILDENMTRYQLVHSVDVAAQALGVEPCNWRAAVAKALAHCELAEVREAEQSLARLPTETRGHWVIRTIRARLCFVKRDFEAARVEAREILRSGHELPQWLKAMVADGEPRVTTAAHVQR